MPNVFEGGTRDTIRSGPSRSKAFSKSKEITHDFTTIG